MQRQWYAVHIWSGHENKVKTNIERRAETLNLQDKIFRILIPTDTEMRNRNGKKTEYKRKVFPGYILINMVLDDTTWHLIKNTSGVTGFVSSGTPPKPVPLQEKEVQDILDALEPGVNKPKSLWEKNQIVRVTAGPFADFTGKIEEVDEKKEKLKVLISIFGRDTPVELDYNQVEKLT